MPRRFTREGVAAFVDHTLLKPEATEHDVVALVSEAAELEVFAVCVSPSMVPVAKSFRSADLQIASVVGFPSGKHVSAIKAEEARLAVAAGADEIDMVIDIGAALSGDFDAVRGDIAAVFEAIPDYVVLKVIVESAALLSLGDGPLLVDVCRIAEEAGRRFREDLDGLSPQRRRVGAGGRVDGRRGRRPPRRQGQRRHPHRRRRRRDAARRGDAARAVGHPRGARRAGLTALASYSPAKQGSSLLFGIDAFWVENWLTTPVSVTCTLSALIPIG